MTQKQMLLQEAIGGVSLSRVLTALENSRYSFYDGQIYEIYTDYIYESVFPSGANALCFWDLLKYDGSDATLFDQDQETQDILYSIICDA